MVILIYVFRSTGKYRSGKMYPSINDVLLHFSQPLEKPLFISKVKGKVYYYLTDIFAKG